MKTPLNKLLTTFDKTTNSYKFYWWLSILNLIKKSEQKKFTFNQIAVEMLVTVWYPVIYYKISLGKQDQLSKLILFVQDWYALPDEIDERSLREFLFERVAENDPHIMNAIKTMTLYVPYRFIRPWFPELSTLKDSEVNKSILKSQQSLKEKAPYKINSEENFIELDSDWFRWIIETMGFIENFTLFKLFSYVEKNNPDMPNVSLKLFKPNQRKLTMATKFWRSFIDTNTSEYLSVFEKKPMIKIEHLAIDHFLPWSYLTHDQLWNLHPIERDVNSKKGNKLPDLIYLNDFCNIQYHFLHFLASQNTNLLMDYNTLFAISNDDLKKIKINKFNKLLKSKIQIEHQFAQNRGFDGNWTYLI